MPKPNKQRIIARNRKARFDYAFDRFFEAGIALEGWEVKSLRAGKANLTDSYVIMENGEAFLKGLRIDPLASASTHVEPTANRTRKLLLHNHELGQIYSATQTKGRTCIALSIYWRAHLVKCEIGLAVGRKKVDKRQLLRERETKREQERTLRSR